LLSVDKSAENAAHLQRDTPGRNQSFNSFHRFH
jgi:hypothetical protein